MRLGSSAAHEVARLETLNARGRLLALYRQGDVIPGAATVGHGKLLPRLRAVIPGRQAWDLAVEAFDNLLVSTGGQTHMNTVLQGLHALSVEDVKAVELPSPEPHLPADSGTPMAAGMDLFADGLVRIGVWECSPGGYPSSKDGLSEVMHFVAGRGTIIAADGQRHRIGPGVTFVAEDGWRGRWEIEETVRKLFVIWSTATATGLEAEE